MAAENKRRSNIADAKTKRVVDKHGHRLALLEATASVIVKYGISGATISRIQEESGLSRGLIHLHFQSKDKLIAALAKHLDAEYRNNRMRAIATAGVGPTERLSVFVRSEFSHRVLNQKIAAVWMALRSEYNSRREILPDIETRDKAVYREIYSCFREIARKKRRRIDCRKATLAVMATLEGMLTDFHLHPDKFDRDAAIDVCLYIIETFTGRARAVAGDHS